MAEKSSNTKLIAGFSFLLFGGLLLLKTTGHLRSAGALWPVFLIIAGLFSLYYSFIKGSTERYILVGMVCTLGGVFFLLSNTVLSEGDMRKLWPVFMLIAGVSLVPYALKKSRNARIVLLVPALVISLLSLGFLFFSLGLASVEFNAFISRWWPALFLIVGLILIISYLRKKISRLRRE